MLKHSKFSGLSGFLTLWAGQSISTLGTSMTNFAVLIWVYQQEGTATSVALLSVFSLLPSIFLCFMAGTLTDRWDKKKIMLLSDLVAAIGTLTIFILFSTGRLQIWHLYIINFIISFMNAFQNPAAYVAITLLTPKEHFVRATGLNSLSSSLTRILTPALATAVLAFGGLKTVLIFDLVTFLIAFFTLLLFIKVPKIESAGEKEYEPFLKSCFAGIRFLKEHNAIFYIILFFAFINLISNIGGNGMISVLILSRTGGNETILGMVTSAVGIGTLIGSVLVTIAKPAKSRSKVIFLSCAISFFLCDVLWGLGRNTAIWVFAALAGNLPLPFLTANLTYIMRTKVPVEMQGRVFSARDTIQYSTIPLGYFLGGILADHVFEPFMLAPSRLRDALSILTGSGPGSGIALIFLISGITGCLASLIALHKPVYKELDE